MFFLSLNLLIQEIKHCENYTDTIVYRQGQIQEHQFDHSDSPTWFLQNTWILKLMIPLIHCIMLLSFICIFLLLTLFSWRLIQRWFYHLVELKIQYTCFGQVKNINKHKTIKNRKPHQQLHKITLCLEMGQRHLLVIKLLFLRWHFLNVQFKLYINLYKNV